MSASFTRHCSRKAAGERGDMVQRANAAKEFWVKVKLQVQGLVQGQPIKYSCMLPRDYDAGAIGTRLRIRLLLSQPI